MPDSNKEPAQLSLQDPVTLQNLFPEEETLTEESSTPEKSRSVRKPVETLAFIPLEASRLTFMARKVFNVLMRLAQDQGGEESVYRARLCEVVEGVNLNSNNTRHLKETICSMVSTVVVWQSPTKDEGGNWTASALVSQVSLKREGHESWIEWGYSPIINESIHRGSPFARVSEEMQNRFKTLAGLTLYEICIRYINVPGGKTPSRHWGWWRPVLVGEREDEPTSIYNQWKYFNRDILSKAIAEVNAYGDIFIELIVKKKGVSVNEIQFRVKRPRTTFGPPPKVTPVNMEFLGRAARLKIPTEKIDSLLNSYGEQFLSEKMAVLEQVMELVKQERHPGVKSPFGYLQTLLGISNSKSKSNDSKLPLPLNTHERPGENPRGAMLAQTRAKFDTLSNEQKAALEDSFEASGFPSQIPIRPNTRSAWKEREPGKRSAMTGPVSSAFFSFVARRFYGDDWDKASK